MMTKIGGVGDTGVEVFVLIGVVGLAACQSNEASRETATDATHTLAPAVARARQ